jgi:hypothetical protein
MREQMRRFAEINVNSQASRSARYDQGISHPQRKNDEDAAESVPLDVSGALTPSDWQCTRCGARLDGAALKIYTSRFAFGGQELAMCPHCGGAAQNLYQESIRQTDQFEQQLRKRKTSLRNGFFFGAACALFLITPSTYTYLLLWIASFWVGPLTEVHLKMKLGAVFTIMWAGFLGTVVIKLLGMNHLGKLLVWLLITVVIVAAGWFIEKVAAFGGGLFYKG